MAYELTTGHMGVYLPPWQNYMLKADDAREELKELIRKAFNKEGNYLEERMQAAMRKNEEYSISYPVNPPIIDKRRISNQKDHE